MSLFNNLCENLLAEMANPRGGVYTPKELGDKTPGWASKEKFGTQAGKYTGAQMLEYLGKFLADNADREFDYKDLQGSIQQFLKYKLGFGGTAATYWSRTLGNTIHGFGYKPEKPVEAEPEPSTDEFPEEEVPEISSPETSSKSSESPTETPEAPEVPKEALDFFTKKVLDYAKEAEGETLTAREITPFLSAVDAEVKGALNKMNKSNEIHTPADKEAAKNKIIAKFVPDVQKALEKLTKSGDLKKEGEGFIYTAPAAAEGEGSGEVTTLDSDEEDSGEDEDVINKYTSNWGDTSSRGNPFMSDSVDFNAIYKDIFKTQGLIKD